MPKTFKTPTRTISNRGEHPRFIGLLTSPKARGGSSPWLMNDEREVMPFDSLSAMICALYLDWRKDVESFAFEPKVHKFSEVDALAALRCIPDFEVVLTTGEVEMVEAKYSKQDLREVEKERLELASQHFAAVGMPYRAVFRKDLEIDGFADTLFLLRPYGLLNYSEPVLARAHGRLEKFDAADLHTWRERAVEARVSVTLLYKLLYLERLPLVYKPLQFVELEKWRA
jgi:hypothetical protein